MSPCRLCVQAVARQLPGWTTDAWRQLLLDRERNSARVKARTRHRLSHKRWTLLRIELEFVEVAKNTVVRQDAARVAKVAGQPPAACATRNER